jgi:hypothetical protein
MGPPPVILLALKGEEDILPQQSEFITNYVAFFYFYEISYTLIISYYTKLPHRRWGTY